MSWAARAGRPLSVTASIGIALGPARAREELLRDADLALYEAKAGRAQPLRAVRVEHADALAQTA